MIDRDDLDAGICDGPNAPRPPETIDDDEVLGWVLFADVDLDDPEAIEYRRMEWAALFGDGEVIDVDQHGGGHDGIIGRVVDEVREFFGLDADDDEGEHR